MERGSAVLSARLAEVFLNVPREPFVPVFYRRDEDRFTPWGRTDAEADAWLTQVYSDDSLITEVGGVHAEDAGPHGVTGVPTSSSTAPSLMADMLDALDVRHGASVLEIGTGSGYNAALLCQLAGADSVTTVDYSERLTTTARTRLAACGPAPTVRCADGAEGAPGDAPFDRIIATCSVRRIPAAWFDQCVPGGLMVVPLKGALAGGSLARLQKLPDGTAVGRILHTPAAFMPLLSGSREAPKIPESVTGGEQRTSKVSGSVLDDWTFSFFAQLHMSASTVREYHREPDGAHVTTLFDPVDDSYARIADRTPEPGATVVTSGRRDLWEPLEEAYEQWLTLHRPRREWFTVNATPDRQTVSYAAPDGRAWDWDL
ncbi:methyltransferase domain-containing protein [Streptomyces corynorhini]|uniref:Protein-L-isoaspartate O-methyltransferase n=1 Tax=Streptomyces corynorhini TaxID=2282652 RepID=A0A370B3U9_9ACTN|nr:methyltransferase domain-containing protein [Streptomyces corynorhini]RDG35059.1 methyltransferase domain-containing protein [Streptomyces corynorhini]